MSTTGTDDLFLVQPSDFVTLTWIQNAKRTHALPVSTDPEMAMSRNIRCAEPPTNKTYLVKTGLIFQFPYSANNPQETSPETQHRQPGHVRCKSFAWLVLSKSHPVTMTRSVTACRAVKYADATGQKS